MFIALLTWVVYSFSNPWCKYLISLVEIYNLPIGFYDGIIKDILLAKGLVCTMFVCGHIHSYDITVGYFYISMNASTFSNSATKWLVISASLLKLK